MRVVTVDPSGQWLDVDDRGRLRRASTVRVTGLAVGDWALVAAGMAVRRLDPVEAADLSSVLAAAAMEPVAGAASEPLAGDTRGTETANPPDRGRAVRREEIGDA